MEKCRNNFLVSCKSQECENCVLAKKSESEESEKVSSESDFGTKVFKPDFEFY